MAWRTPAVDELEALSRDLDRLARMLERADRHSLDDALWEIELGLRHVARRSDARADDLRRVIDRRKTA